MSARKIEWGRCASCGREVPLELLDGKPTLQEGETLEQALDSNADFDRLECRQCYGPGWAPMCEDSLKLEKARR